MIGNISAADDTEIMPELSAAYEFVDSMVSKADSNLLPGAVESIRHHADPGSRSGTPFGPWWHGWALREAFLAGVKWQKENKS